MYVKKINNKKKTVLLSTSIGPRGPPIHLETIDLYTNNIIAPILYARQLTLGRSKYV